MKNRTPSGKTRDALVDRVVDLSRRVNNLLPNPDIFETDTFREFDKAVGELVDRANTRGEAA